MSAGQRKGEWDRDADVPEIKHRRMDHHLRYCNNGLRPLPSAASRSIMPKGLANKLTRSEKKIWIPRQRTIEAMATRPLIDLMTQPQHKAVRPKAEEPEEDGSLPGRP